MNRRQAIRNTALFLGYTASATTIATIMHGCKADPKSAEPDWKPAFLSMDQAKTMGDLAECILPKTDTPGAKEIGIVAFFDSMLQEVVPDEDKQYFMGELKKFQEDCQASHQKKFHECSAEQQMGMVKKYADAAKAASSEGPPAFFDMVRENTVAGYFTSEKIGTEFLKYDPIPGPYQGCIPYEEVGGVWSLS